jgi:hypothetical protein
MPLGNELRHDEHENEVEHGRVHIGEMLAEQRLDARRRRRNPVLISKTST